MVTRVDDYLGSEFVPEYVDSKLIDQSLFHVRWSPSTLDSLVNSIKNNGLLQPIVVRIKKERFEVVAGNRRLEACRRLRWPRIPCLIRELSNKEAYEVGLVENIERKTLTAVEEAVAFRTYIEERGWGGEKELAKRIGRSEEYVSHRIALLRLPPTVLELINTDKISASVGQELVWLEDGGEQKVLAQALITKRQSAREVRKIVRMVKDGISVENAFASVAEDNWSLTDTMKRDPALARQRNFPKILGKSILAFRICQFRLDSIIEKLEPGSNEDVLKQLLFEKRLLLHNQIDDLIHFKKSVSRHS